MVDSPHLVWMICGLILTLAELFIPGLVIIFFGVGAILTGLLLWIVPSISMTWQILFFTVFSVLSLCVFRRFAIAKGKETIAKTNCDVDNDIFQRNVRVVERIAPGGRGKVELDGTNWSAEAEEAIEVGALVTVESREGLVLHVKANSKLDTEIIK